ncbi:MAG: hypothetical protein P1P88_13880 [Bacteroidales bacterium]|nr:hypothetical protein [Bacteroidales bacterium]
MSIKEFLLKHENDLEAYFERLKVNRNKTDIKYSITHLNMSMVFYIKGEIDENITGYKNKVEALLNTNSDLSELNEYTKTLNRGYTFVTESPFLKISENPPLQAFQVTLRLVKN